MNLEVFEIIDSTNDYLKNKALKGELQKGDAVIAFEQTKGRGRRQRCFLSNKGGLYISVCLGDFDYNDESYLSYMPSLAITIKRYILSRFNIDLSIKWPNDLIYKDKKVAGILAETVKGKLIIGIGINLVTSSFTPELKDIAISLLDTNKEINLKEIGLEIVEVIRELKRFSEDKSLFEEYCSTNYHLNKEVTIVDSKSNILAKGICVGFSEIGEILVKINQSLTKKVSLGEIN